MRLKLIIPLFFYAIVTMAQDPTSSQFFFNQLYMNPAFCGITRDERVGFDFRRQWPGVSQSKFETYDAWGDIYSSFLNGGLGVMLSQDVAGDGKLKTTSGGIVQSFEYAIRKIVRMRAGYNVSFVQKKMDWSKLVFSDQLDPVFGNVYTSNVDRQVDRVRTFADFGAGCMFDFRMIKTHHEMISNSFGYSVYHLTQPDESVSGAANKILPRRHTFHFTSTFEPITNGAKSAPWIFSPNIIYERQGTGSGKGIFPFAKEAQFSNLNVGLYLMHKPLIGGLFYRKRKLSGAKDNDAFIIFVGFKQEMPKSLLLKVGYSYDFTVSTLAPNTLGSHELTLSVEFKDRTLKFKKNRRFFNGNTDCEDFGQRSFLF